MSYTAHDTKCRRDCYYLVLAYPVVLIAINFLVASRYLSESDLWYVKIKNRHRNRLGLIEWQGVQ